MSIESTLNSIANANTQKMMDWQKMMSDSSHQREVADLQKAGLNPVLSSGGNGAQSYTTSVDSAVNALGGIAQSRISSAAAIRAASIQAAAARAAAGAQLAGIKYQVDNARNGSFWGILGNLFQTTDVADGIRSLINSGIHQGIPGVVNAASRLFSGDNNRIFQEPTHYSGLTDFRSAGSSLNIRRYSEPTQDYLYNLASVKVGVNRSDLTPYDMRLFLKYMQTNNPVNLYSLYARHPEGRNRRR